MLDTSSKNIQGIADLVITAPIKQGFIDAFENVTFETRLRLATDAFHQMRVIAREYEPIKPFTDVAERIQSLLAFRIGILDTEPQRTLYLAATFDRAWEPYMRLIWDPLGPFLDVLLCNCEDYVAACDSTFSEYAAWVRAHQADSTIFYATTPLAVGDQVYLIKLEQMQRSGGGSPGADLALATMTADDPEILAAAVRGAVLQDPAQAVQFLTMATEAVVVLYRLADYYPPDRPTAEGRYLKRAAKDLLKGWDTTDPRQLPPAVRQLHAEMFAWLEDQPAFGTKAQADPRFVRSQVQAGILSGYDLPAIAHEAMVKQGCLLLFSVTNATKARALIGQFVGQLSWEGEVINPGERTYLNLAISYRGLQNLELPPDSLAAFPKEFQQGMDVRAGLLGDVHDNHPLNWVGPSRFIRTRDEVAAAAGAPAPPDRVEPSEIDLIVQVRSSRGGWGYTPIPNDEGALRNSPHPLAPLVLDLMARSSAAGLDLLSIEPMRRLPGAPAKGAPQTVREHFGFVDFASQPTQQLGPRQDSRDDVKLGELVIGYANDRGDPPPKPNPILDNGSFLVIRKISQDVAALQSFISRPPGDDPPTLAGEQLLAKMMGRYRDGEPLAYFGAGGLNDFDFQADGTGQLCPFQAHIRRTNPRLTGFESRPGCPSPPPPFGRPTPRIVRRGMSYGPTIDEDPNATERGSIFMAYVASLAEQYEVIQRWINGGSSTGVAAIQNDPLIGVHPISGPKTFRFALEDGKVVRVDIPTPFVGLEWGLYLFAPSKHAIAEIVKGPVVQPQIGEATRGEAIIASLARLPFDRERLAWKTYLEDFSTKDPAERADTPNVWSAIRAHHGGVLRTPQGILVADKGRIEQVLTDSEGNYSVSGQEARMQQSFGEIYVGLDAGSQYASESTATNEILGKVTKEEAFDVAHAAAGAILKTILDVVQGLGQQKPEIDLRRDLITPSLAIVCNEWFGLPEDPMPEAGASNPLDQPPFIVAGGWSWAPLATRKPRCPGDFMAPSRYCFYPDPTPAIAAYGMEQGQALHKAAKAYFDRLRPADGTPPSAPTAPLALAMFEAISDNDLLSRTMIGVMTGALPPIDGNLRSVLYDWQQDKAFSRHQSARAASSARPFDWAIDCLEGPMMRAMQKRPAPDMLWRTAIRAHQLGDVSVNLGDMVVLALVSATLDDLNNGHTGVDTVFGGDRSVAPHPLHACPAYQMAIGTMLGILTALFEVGRIEALPAPLLVRLHRRA